jgi:hypothetical protein
MIRTLFLALLSLSVLVAACSSEPTSGKGSVKIGGKSNFLLPPAHPGYLSGSTLMLPEEAVLPAVHTAYCFPGVPVAGNFGIGSAVGNELSLIVLPININLDTNQLGSYSVTVSIVNPVLNLDPSGVSGSHSFLATGSCLDRGCYADCGDYPAYFPNLYQRAAGFEAMPAVVGNAATITVSATETAAAPPTTGIVNLCNIPFRVVGALPDTGILITFTVDDLRDRGGNPIASVAYSGIVTRNFHIIYN